MMEEGCVGCGLLRLVLIVVRTRETKMKVRFTGWTRLGTPYVVSVLVEVRMTFGEASVIVVVMVEKPRDVAIRPVESD